VTVITRMDDDPTTFEHTALAAASSSPVDGGIDDCVAALDVGGPMVLGGDWMPRSPAAVQRPGVPGAPKSQNRPVMNSSALSVT